MAISAEQIKELREKSGAGVMECRNALIKFEGDMEKAMDLLRQKGREIAEKKKDRTTAEGRVESYIHMGGKVGVLIEVNCETDFCAKSEEFVELVKELALQIAALNARFVSVDTVPEEVVKEQQELFQRMAAEEKKPPAVAEKVVAGRMQKFFDEHCLLEQLYIRDDSKKVKDYISEKVGKIRENIVVKRFVRYALQD